MPVPANPLLDLDPGIGQVASSIRFEVVDRDLEVVGTVRPLEAASINAKVQGNIKRTLNGVRLGESALRDLDPFRHRIKPWWVLEDGTEWPLGVFVFTASAIHVGTYVSTLDTTLMDQEHILDQGTNATFSIAAGGSIRTAVEALIGQLRITNVVLPSTTVTVGDPVVWAAGTSRLRILNELCALAGWLSPYFDNDGVLVIRTPPDVDHDAPDHVYDSNAQHRCRILRASIVQNDNLLDAPNVFVVICSGPSDGEIVGAAQVDPRLPWSVANRGYEVVEVIRVQGLTSTAQAEYLAAVYASQAGGYRNVTFDGTADPRHDLFQLVEYDGVTYREIAWNLTLKPGGSHSHTLTRGGFPRSG